MITECTIKIDGQALSPEVWLDMAEVEVDTNLYLPDMFILTLKNDLDPQKVFTYTDSDKPFAVGKAVVISMTSADDYGNQAKGEIFSGEITGLEPMFTDHGVALLRVRGYHKLHRMTYGKKTRTFLNMTDADIIKKIMGECGLQAGTIDASLTKVTYKYVMQYNQSDWDFMWSRVRLYGCYIYSDGAGKVKIVNTKTVRSGGAIPLEWGKSLASFEPRLTVRGMLNKATTTGWDDKQKKLVQGQASSPVSGVSTGLGKTGTQLLSSALSISTADETSLVMPFTTQQEADGHAQARLDESEGNFITAEGMDRWGTPTLLAGCQVDIKRVGTRWNGKYLVTAARHTFSHGTYKVHFSVTGRNANTLQDLLGQGEKEERNLVQGVVVAMVTNVEDPDKTGKVKIKFPWMPKNQGAEQESFWARIATPSAGAERGFYYLPEVNDEVLVAFEHGDINYPFIVGGLWSGVDKPPPGEGEIYSGGKVNQRIIKSRTGHLIILDDSQGKEKIVVKDKSGNNSIIIDSANKTMSFKCEGDIKIEAGGLLTITSTKDFSIEGKAKGTVKTMQDMTLEATGKASMKGTTGLNLESTASAKIKGMMVEVAGDTTTKLSGSAMVEISGGIVKIN
jgi:uncharacterized protein involved in type VI secretion and phage assembly